MNAPMSGRGHGAAPSALGYAYQAEVALVELVRRAKVEPATKLTIERYDDVAFEGDGRPRELLQTKHHIRGVGNLGDRSRDLWRTLRAWVDAIRTGGATLPGATFSLLTTATAPNGSAASLLRPDGRDGATALATLELVARAGGQAANAADYEAFLRLGDDQRRALIDAVVVLDQAPGLADVTPTLIQELGWSLRPRFREQMAERLLEWWDRRVIRHLLTGQAPIEADEVFFELDACATSSRLPTAHRRHSRGGGPARARRGRTRLRPPAAAVGDVKPPPRTCHPRLQARLHAACALDRRRAGELARAAPI